MKELAFIASSYLFTVPLFFIGMVFYGSWMWDTKNKYNDVRVWLVIFSIFCVELIFLMRESIWAYAFYIKGPIIYQGIRDILDYIIALKIGTMLYAYTVIFAYFYARSERIFVVMRCWFSKGLGLFALLYSLLTYSIY